MNTEKPKLERITMQKIFGFILDIFNLEKGLIYTVKELTINPGKAVRAYLFEDREKLVKPFRYLILSTAIMAFLTINYIGFENSEFLQGLEAGYTMSGGEKEKDEVFVKKMDQLVIDFKTAFSKYYNSFIIFSVPFYALAFLWFLRSPKLNYAEHLVLVSYLIAHQSVLNILMTPLIKYSSIGLLAYIVLSTFYMFYLLMQFFDYKFIAGFFRVLGGYALGSFIYSLVFAAIIVLMLFSKLA